MGIKVSKLTKRWMKDPGFKRAYDSLEEEFALANVLAGARINAKLSQSEVASKMGVSQPTIARLEGGSAKPSLAMLRRFAEATGMRVRLSLEPVPPTVKKRRRPAQSLSLSGDRVNRPHRRKHTAAPA